MDAVISGRAGTALVINESSLYSFDVDDTNTFVSRQQSDLPFLLGDAIDLQFLENVELPQVRQQLETAYNNACALDLTLILLDSDLSDEVRKEAAEELEALFADSQIIEQLENLFYARPLPDSADITGAVDRIEKLQAKTVTDVMRKLFDSQPSIRKVFQAWSAIAVNEFGGEERKATFQHQAIYEGLFRALVIEYSDGKINGSRIAEAFKQYNQADDQKSEPRKSAVDKDIFRVSITANTNEQPFITTALAPKQAEEDSFFEAIDAARLGDKQAANYLFSHPKIIKMSQVIGVRLARDNRDDDYKNAQDFQQEILLKLWQKITTFEGGSEKKFWGWLWRIAKNILKDNRRKTNREIKVIEKNGLVSIDGKSEDDPFLKLAIKEWWYGLNERQMLVMKLSVEGYPPSDIVQKLGVSKSTTYRILKEAQSRLEERLYGRKKQ